MKDFRMKKKTETIYAAAPSRRKLLGWLGMITAGTLVLKMIPLGFASRGLKQSGKADKKVNILANDLAVGRRKKVSPNG